MSEENHVPEMSAPVLTPDGTALLPRRGGPRGLLPSTWLSRTLRLEYASADGSPVETSGTLLDWYPAGVVLQIAGAKVLIPWERLVLVELVED